MDSTVWRELRGRSAADGIDEVTRSWDDVWNPSYGILYFGVDTHHDPEIRSDAEEAPRRTERQVSLLFGIDSSTHR